jgi:perosamine synthetase
MTMGKVKIPWARPMFVGSEKAYVMEALDSTWISGGAYVERFEEEFAKTIKAPYVITTSSGTTALYLAILGLGIGPGDEVIMPGFTFAAIANMVIAAGATPVFCDVDPHTWCIDPQSAEEAITKKTKAICAVHLYGNVCEMDRLAAICRKHRLFLIEDVAEAAMSRYKDRFAGTLSDVAAFSFQATKTIAMGEGGCVTAKNKDLYARMKTIRNHGIDRKRYYWHTVIGHNFRLPNLQAAIGCAQLEKIQTILLRRKELAQVYREQLEKIPGVIEQQIKSNVDPAVWAIAVKIDPKVWGKSRDRLLAQLLEAGIEGRPGFYPLQTMPLYQGFARRTLPVATDVGANILSLPFFLGLTEKQIIWMCDQLRRLRKP